jgi:hypothetical protein
MTIDSELVGSHLVELLVVLVDSIRSSVLGGAHGSIPYGGDDGQKVHHPPKLDKVKAVVKE